MLTKSGYKQNNSVGRVDYFYKNTLTFFYKNNRQNIWNF